VPMRFFRLSRPSTARSTSRASGGISATGNFFHELRRYTDERPSALLKIVLSCK
jgi:hypothetical protein